MHVIPELITPHTYEKFHTDWQNVDLRSDYIERYVSGVQSFIPNLLPELAVQLSAEETLDILQRKLGDVLDLALAPAYTNPDVLPATLPAAIQSPVAIESDPQWLKLSNMVGINVRTIHSFWNVIKYTLTIPEAQDSIHLLPIWEPGVVGSIYGISSWELNPEFYSAELAEAVPHLNTTERQLKAIVNVLHALSKTVGMDVIPHTDRFSEMAFTHPAYYEWVQRRDTEITDHSNNLHEDVQAVLISYIREHGPAILEEPLPDPLEAFYTAAVDEARRSRILFGHPQDFSGRAARRNVLVQYLYSFGYEPLPGTMGPPYRGVKIDTGDAAKKIDSNGMVWRDYQFINPESMSRVFGPLARYKLYERLADNCNWQIDFAAPREEVWRYVCDHYAAVQRRFGFDFMRGDMSHVQMRPDGVPEQVDDYYDLLRAVKNRIRYEESVPYFGYFAESFLAPPNIMGYGVELDHLEASEAETTLGNLQSMVVGSEQFMTSLRQYHDIVQTRACAPNFTVIAADKDDPRFDEFYIKGNEARLFINLFLTDMPGYMSLGFTCRDVHHEPAPNEHYTKLFVFQEQVGPKATSGDYIWGQNAALFHHITRLRLYADSVFYQIKDRQIRWLLPPDPTSSVKVIAWTQAACPEYLFVVNLDIDQPLRNFSIPAIPDRSGEDWLFEFSTARQLEKPDPRLRFNGFHYRIAEIAPGEGRVYKVASPLSSTSDQSG